MLTWHLPGPARFVDELVDALRGGRHAVLQWPAGGPALRGLKNVVRDRLHECMDVALREFPVVPGRAPLTQLADAFGLDLRAALTLENLSATDDFPGSVLWLDGLTPEAWPAWQAVLADLGRRNAEVRVVDRALVVAVLHGDEAQRPADVGLKRLRWDGRLDELDVTLYAAHLLRGRAGGGELAVLANVLAQVALFDVALLERLAAGPLDDILSPERVLRDYAGEREWTAHTPDRWALGTAARFGDRPRVHSAVKVLAGGVQRRLWRGQANVLLGVLEEHRQDLVDRYRPHLRLPHRVSYGERVEWLTEAGQLELGHLLYQVRQGLCRMAPEDHHWLELLTDARHRLAHLKPVSPGDVARLVGRPVPVDAAG